MIEVVQVVSETPECSGTTKDIEGGLSDNTLTHGEDCDIVDFSYHYESEEDTKDRMKITCPIRMNHRHERACNLEKNAKLMVKKCNKQNNIIVVVFKKGDHVSVAIPKHCVTLQICCVYHVLFFISCLGKIQPID